MCNITIKNNMSEKNIKYTNTKKKIEHHQQWQLFLNYISVFYDKDLFKKKDFREEYFFRKRSSELVHI